MRGLLLDTHVLLWWFTDSEQLSAPARSAIADTDVAVHASAASAWEIATKTRIGKLTSLPDAAQRYAELVAAGGFTHLPVDHRHALRAGGFDAPHRDPFDRMLAAQSEVEELVLVTRDPAFEQFDVEVLW